MLLRLLEAAVLVLPLLVASPASAAQVSVSGAWMRALPANLPAGGYFEIKNLGKSEIAITGAQSPACGMLMLHKSSNANGMDTMSGMPSVAVTAGGTVAFAPGGYHLMCMSPTAVLKPGVKVPVTLQFADGTKVSVSFAVKNARGK